MWTPTGASSVAVPAAVLRSSSARSSFSAAMSERTRMRAAPRFETSSIFSTV